MTDLGQFLNVPADVAQPAPSRPKHPSGWEPGVDTARGEIVAPPSTDPSEPDDWDEILQEFRLDPERWEVISDRVNVRTWDAHTADGPRRFYYFKADVRPRQPGQTADVEALCKRISRHRYRPSAPAATEPQSALVVCLADWQTGPDPEGIVDHVLRLKNTVVDRLKRERPDMLYVVGMGDMVEGCGNDWYAMQDFTVELDRRQQTKLVRRLLIDLLTTWARYVPAVVVGCVPGNHGQNRRDGKAYTTFEDNDDIAVFEQAAEILSANPDAYGHVKFTIPDGDMSLTLDVAGTVVGFIHGHQAGRGATPQQKIQTWWRGKQAARHPVGDADVLVNGHFHHFCAVEDGPRTWLQCPALAQSRWWEESGGQPTAEGTLTFVCTPEGWDDVKILR